MISLVTVFLASTFSIDCGKAVNTHGVDKNSSAKVLLKKESWPIVVCAELAPRYKSVSMQVISRSGSYKRDNQEKRNKKGFFTIGDISAGRIKATWVAKGDASHKETIWLNVKATKKTWVFRRDLKPEMKIRKSHVRFKEVDVADVEGVQDLPLKSPVGKVTKKNARKGQVVTENMLAEPPLIRKNNEVVVIATNDGLMIKTRALALSTGWELGETVLIKINDSTDSIRAIVSGENKVNVEI